MQYAIVNGVRLEPFKGGKGLCICCNALVVSRFGSINAHHWAHKNVKDCDSWYEPETEWHRNWKNQFPESFREQSFFDEKAKEHHRADVHTPSGVILEFQNSSISVEEITSRDQFYKKLIWVVNGSHFSKNIELDYIPNPEDSKLDEYEITNTKHCILNFKNEIIKGERLLQIFGFQDLKLKPASGYFSFVWKNQRTSWLESKSYIFFDFNDDKFLYLLKRRKQLTQDFLYLKLVSKSDFIAKYSNK